MTGLPYKVTPVFDQSTLPAGLRRVHSTKEGVWGVVRVLEGRLRLFFPETDRDLVLTPGKPGLLEPCEPHFVEPLSPFRMQVEFYRSSPTTPEDPAAPAAPSARGA
jgi:hemoglobin